MQSAPRTAARAVRCLRPHLQRQSRRHASDSHGSHGSSHETHHAGPSTESFGSGFYIALAALPAFFAIYKFTAQGTDQQPYITRLITDTYADYKTKWADRNDLHTRAMEQAASDRALFMNEPNQSIRYVDVRFPEQVNGGSPWNVPAGHGSANMDVLIRKYEKENREAQEEKLQQLRENRVPVEQPFESFVKITPAANDS